jgi:ribosomal protein S18 acetylase RimI-like enzyme
MASRRYDSEEVPALVQHMPVTLRTIRPEDEAFLSQVYASTRAEELALVAWDDEQKQAFLQMQFNAQRLSYQQQFPQAEYQVVMRGEIPAGRLIVDRSDEVVLLIDIALLPEHRNAGIGSSLIRDLQAEAAQAERPVRLHVENFNPAFQLYERLGFTRVAENGFYWLMEWRAKDERAMKND